MIRRVKHALYWHMLLQSLLVRTFVAKCYSHLSLQSLLAPASKKRNAHQSSGCGAVNRKVFISPSAGELSIGKCSSAIPLWTHQQESVHRGSGRAAVNTKSVHLPSGRGAVNKNCFIAGLRPWSSLYESVGLGRKPCAFLKDVARHCRKPCAFLQDVPGDVQKTLVFSERRSNLEKKKNQFFFL